MKRYAESETIFRLCLRNATTILGIDWTTTRDSIPTAQELRQQVTNERI